MNGSVMCAREASPEESLYSALSEEDLMTIGLDYDDTWTADPKFWRKFVHMALDAGHTVIMVTQRCRCYPEQVEDVEAEIGSLIPIIFAGDPLLPQSKSQAARTVGYEVDIWIDDRPESILVPMYRVRSEEEI